MTKNSPPSDSLVLIAGTNEVATREQQNRILSTPSECMLIVGTLPHRHDLPINNTIDEEVVLVVHEPREKADRASCRHSPQSTQFWDTDCGTALSYTCHLRRCCEVTTKKE
ncbi:hypothetical protein J6590_102689 [Homalodisca vitripennis]|nr:hypothetical protein J6590_102689 [Homalodisca vitripennis]